MNKKIIGTFALAAFIGVTACEQDRDDTYVDPAHEDPATAPTIQDDPMMDDPMMDDPAMRDTLPRNDEFDDEWGEDDDLDTDATY